MILSVILICLGIQFGLYQHNLAFAEPGMDLDNSEIHEDMKQSSEHAFSIMQQQLNAYKEKLQDSERKLDDFQQVNGIISLEAQIKLLLQQRKSLDDSLKETQNNSLGYKEKLAWIKGQISEVSREIPLSKTSSEKGIIGSAKTNLLRLQLKEQQLLTKYTAESPHLRAVHDEMEVISNFIKEQELVEAESVSTGKNPLYAAMEMQLFQTQAELVSAEAKGGGIKQQIVEIDKKLESFRRLRPGLDELLRQVKSDESNYMNYLTKVGATPSKDYQVQVGDQLDIKFFFNPELNENILVRPDGRIALQLIGEITVVGHTVEQIREILIKRYEGQLKNPEVAVLLRSSHVLPGAMSGTATSQSGAGGGRGN